MADEDTEYLKLPIDEKCVHKNWKARVSGYEEAKKLFERLDNEKDPEYSKYAGILKKILSENNALAQEKGVVAVQAYLENAALAPKTANEVVPVIIQKCLGASRAKTKEMGVELCMTYIELEKHEVVIDELLKGLDHKQPKIVAACCLVLRSAITSFTTKVVPAKPIIKVLPKVFANRDKNARDEARQLACVIYQHVGAAIKVQLQPNVLMKELDDEFEKLTVTKQLPTRYRKSQKPPPGEEPSTQTTTGNDTGAGQEPEVIDPYDLADSVDILSKLPKEFYEQIESKKWQERKEMLDVVEKLSESLKFEAGDYGDLMRVLRKVLSKDTNVMLVQQAAKATTNLARGLRKKFASFSVQMIASIIERYKEKKPSVIAALRDAADACFYATTIAAILDEVIPAIGHKNPVVKTETCWFMYRCVCQTPASGLKKDVLKPLCGQLVKRLEDPQPDLREASSMALAAAWKAVGDKPMNQFFADMEKMRMEKIKECLDKVDRKGKKGSVTVLTKSDPEKPAAPVTDQPPPKPVAKPVVTKSGPPKKKPGSAAAPAKTKKRAADKPVVELPTEMTIGYEEALEIMTEKVGEEVTGNLASTNWKERLASMELLQEDAPVQAILRVLAGKKGDWKETNFQVLIQKFTAVSRLCSFKVTVTSALVAIPGLVEKIGDPKGGAPAQEALTSLTECLGAPWMVDQVVAVETKVPKTQTEVLLWLSKTIREFGFAGMKPKCLVDVCKKQLTAMNQKIREACVSLLGTLYLYMGGSLRLLFETEKPTTLAVIDQEFEHLKGQKPAAPTRCKKGAQAVTQEEAEEVEEIPIEDLLPRTDIADKVTEGLLAELADPKWKVRGEALDKVETILKENKLLTPNVGELPTALGQRLVDTNKMLASSALTLTAQMASQMGPKCKPLFPSLYPNIINLLKESKQTVRQTAVNCLNAWEEQIKLAPFFNDEILLNALVKGNPSQRMEIYSWLDTKMGNYKSLPKEELQLILPTIYAHVEDRSADVRRTANLALPWFVAHLGIERALRATSKLGLSNKTTVVTLLEKLRTTAPDLKASLGGGMKKTAKNVTVETPAIGVEVVETDVPVERKDVPALQTVEAADEDSRETEKKNKKGRKSMAVAPPPAKGDRKDEDTGPALLDNNKKDLRMKEEAALKVLKWNFPAPTFEHVDLLKERFQPVVGKTLFSQLFHADFKMHLQALCTLLDCVDSCPGACQAQLDLILKWVTLRFFDTNTSVLLKTLEFVAVLLAKLDERNYRLLEQEAVAFLPYLVPKIGDAKDEIRKRVKAVFRAVLKVYPYSKMFGYIMEGTKTKALKEVSAQISDRDAGVRKASLNVLVVVFSQMGDQVYKLVGKLSAKDRSLLEERIKWSGAVAKTTQRPNTAPTESRRNDMSEQPGPDKPADAPSSKLTNYSTIVKKTHSSSTVPGDGDGSGRKATIKAYPFFNIDIATLEAKYPSADDVIPVTTIDHNMEAELESLMGDNIMMPVVKTNNSSNSQCALFLRNIKDVQSLIDGLISQIASADTNTSIETMTKVDLLLTDADKYPLLGDHVDRLLMTTSLQLQTVTLKVDNSERLFKLYRTAIGMLLAMLQHKDLAAKASQDALANSFNCFFKVMKDHRLINHDEMPQIIRSLNVLVSEIISRCNFTSTLTALIGLLNEYITTGSRNVELVVKCMYRFIKKLINNLVVHIDLTALLASIHDFLVAHPVPSFQGQESMIALRTIKTLIYYVVSANRSTILDHLGDVDDSYLHRYIQKTLAKLPPTQPTVQSNDCTVVEQLLERIVTRETSRQALIDLSDFKKVNPDVNVDAYIARYPEHVRKYIHNGLWYVSRYRNDALTLRHLSANDQQPHVPDNYQDRVNHFRKILDLPLEKRAPSVSEGNDEKENVAVGGEEAAAVDERQPVAVESANSLSDLKRRLALVKKAK